SRPFTLGSARLLELVLDERFEKNRTQRVHLDAVDEKGRRPLHVELTPERRVGAHLFQYLRILRVEVRDARDLLRAVLDPRRRHLLLAREEIVRHLRALPLALRHADSLGPFAP